MNSGRRGVPPRGRPAPTGAASTQVIVPTVYLPLPSPHVRPGTAVRPGNLRLENYRINNVLSAIGRGQLRVLEQRVQRKREIFAFYRHALAGACPPGPQFWGRGMCFPQDWGVGGPLTRRDFNRSPAAARGLGRRPLPSSCAPSPHPLSALRSPVSTLRSPVSENRLARPLRYAILPDVVDMRTIANTDRRRECTTH